MRILLDENFPLPLLRRLRQRGHAVEHIIELGRRGLPDASIQQRLLSEAILFLTQDTEFATFTIDRTATVIVSSVRQARPIGERVDLWVRAVEQFLDRRPPHKLLEILDSGELVPWSVIEE